MSDLPLTGGDLRVIADAVDEVEATNLAASQVLGRIEVYRPDGDDRVGWVTRFDESQPDMGWGFVPETEP
jgi:hypothetical protein